MKIKFAIVPVVLAVMAYTSSCNRSSDQSAARDTTYTLTVQLRGGDSSNLLLTYVLDNTRKTDTARGTAGHYVFTGKQDVPLQAQLRLATDTTYDMLSFYLENGKIEVAAARDSLRSGKVSGSPTNDDRRILETQLTAVNKETELLMAGYRKIPEDDTRRQDSLMQAYNKISQQRLKVVKSFIREHPASYVSAYEVSEQFFYNPDVVQFDSAFQLLDSTLRASKLGKSIGDRLAIEKRIAVGQVAPDFTLNDTKGKPFTLTTLAGKYILIDFWASWCGPCRMENPNLVKAYAAFHKKGFEIVGVSIDDAQDKDKWLKAIADDHLPWIHVSDLKGWKSEVARTYGINGIPMNFLLNPDGTIIARGLRGGDVDKKLKELIKG